MSSFAPSDEASALKMKQPNGSWWARMSRRTKLILAVVTSVIILGLALGLGLGLGLGGRNEDGSEQPDTTATPSALPTPANNTQIWQPAVNSTWQIVLLQALQLDATSTSVSPDVDVYDIDLFDNSKVVVDALHRLGKRVICYFSAGSYEPNRPDSGEFQASDRGSELDGWPGEYWLNISSANVRSIMSKRIQLASQNGCDAVDPDNVDGYDNSNGLGLSAVDAVDFIGFLAAEARSHNLGIGLKNAGALISDVLPVVQFSVNEQCVHFDECTLFSPFVLAGKPVFHIEYPSEVKADFVSNFCKDSGPGDGSAGFSTVLKNMNLDGWVKYCDGQTANTTLVTQ